jgi:YesN/AraC family two-component response regulator
METTYRIIKTPEYELLKVTDSSHNFPTHIHKKMCIGVIDFGERYLKINNQVKKLIKNDLFIIPPLVAHSCWTRERKVSYTVLCLDNNINIDGEVISKVFGKSNIKIQNIIKYINKYNHKTSFADDITRHIIDFIDKNYSCKIEMDGIAKRLGFSPYHISHLFKETVGLSLRQYITQFRIKKAKECVKNQKLLEIAIDNGFYDQSHFIKYFKKYEGITPKNYYNSIIN